MIKKILLLVNIAFTLLLLASYLTAFIPPHVMPKLSLLGFIYPIALAINLIFILFWLFIKWQYAIFPILCILVRIDYIPALVRLSGTEHNNIQSEKNIKILSYNVCAFRYNVDLNITPQERMDSILNYIQNLNPDIISFQDFQSSKTNKNEIHYILTEKLGFEYYYCAQESKKNLLNNIMYSKFPIVKSGMLLPMRENSSYFIFTDIEKDNKIFRVYNIHLASYKLKQKEKDDFSEIKKGNIKLDDKSKNILKKLIDANVRRSKEIDELKPIFDQTNIPFFIVGDFNDIPFSYTYKTISKNLSDSFVKEGSGVGSTYNGVFPAYRIDYILYSKNFKQYSFEKKDLKYSDHYPISAVFSLKEKK